MSTEVIGVIVVVGISLLSIATYLLVQGNRRKAIAAFAQEHGFTFYHSRTAEELGGLLSPVFSQTASGHNVVEGESDGVRFLVADVRRPTVNESVRREKARLTTVAGIRFSGPRFTATPLPPHKQDRTAGTPEFNRDWTITDSNDASVRAFFRKSVEHFCLAHPNLTLESTGTWLVLYRLKTKTPPEALGRLVQSVCELAKIVHR